MEPTKIPGANRVLAPPPDWDYATDGKCSPLPVLYTGRFFQSAWQPSPEEIDCMRAGAPVIVTIWGQGLPPHAVGTMPKPGYVPIEAYQQAVLALRNLTFMCRTAKGLALGANADPQLLGSIELAEGVVGQIPSDASRASGDPDAQTAVPPSQVANENLLKETLCYLRALRDPRYPASNGPTVGLVPNDQKLGELIGQIEGVLKP